MILAIIQARLQSTRLPQKVLMHMGGKPMIQHVIERVRAVQSIDGLVVATSHGGNGALAAKLDDLGVDCVQWSGPEDDVLGRFIVAASSIRWINPRTQEHDVVDYILRVCGDSPLFDPQSADELIAAAVVSKADYAGYRFKDGVPAITRPNGYFGEVVKLSAMRTANEWLPVDHPAREHVTACMYAEDQSFFPRPFFVKWLDVPQWYVKEKLKNAAVDTLADFNRVKEVVERE
ncbi:MAG: NTP transferase domain-containing protein [Sulfurimonas sp.]|jgi:spore coat polysaccharide biosynthesis protein SpsF (cytidylyltransferase family)